MTNVSDGADFRTAFTSHLLDTSTEITRGKGTTKQLLLLQLHFCVLAGWSVICW